ncbi:hypothetical protein QNL30_15795 [Pseudomonas amygdali pv. morsprunorum]|uniref:Uncharacterized protein n=1 Tax=Pseudomonas amygdali pv. morsprunorum TaxID=129138 RepID=A0AB35R1M0_PSEA0|nr:hypothetical protein [Pseudomonas amygdali pv. morsprunorum]
MFGVNPHHYWLPAHDGNFWGSGLQPHVLQQCPAIIDTYISGDGPSGWKAVQAKPSILAKYRKCVFRDVKLQNLP